jgi:prophage maintenance system killer protein
MFYSLIKNHPFSNGNKRLATTALLVFFYLNDFWLDSEQKGVYTWAVRIAESKRSEQTAVVRQMTKWLHKKLVDRHAATARAGLFGRVWRALNLLVPGRHWFRRRQK